MAKSFAVIGLGSFGRSVAQELIKLEANLLIIDNDADSIARISKFAPNAVILDSTDEESLKDVGISSIDHVIVCIGVDVQASILTTLILKDLGVKKVTVKVKNDYHAKVVEKLGADEIIFPEKQMGRRFARRVISDNILDIMELTDDFSYVEIAAPKSFKGKSLNELDFRKKFGLNVVSIKRDGKIITPKVNEGFLEKDILMIVGSNKEISKFDNRK
ncbi:TrkA family potassium uptake protein [Mycoplasmatota bacterium zrk1]